LKYLAPSESIESILYPETDIQELVETAAGLGFKSIVTQNIRLGLTKNSQEINNTSDLIII